MRNTMNEEIPGANAVAMEERKRNTPVAIHDFTIWSACFIVGVKSVIDAERGFTQLACDQRTGRRGPRSKD